MYDDGSIPPMSPDDFAALAAFAGPLYQQSKTIESYTSESPIPGAQKDYGSMNIRQGLEQAKHLAQASALRQQQAMYVPPADPVFLSEVPYVPPLPATVPSTVEPVPYIPSAQHFPQPGVVTEPLFVKKDAQLEFSFEKNEQQITNDLLKEISGKLTKLLKILDKDEIDKTERQDTIPKLNKTPKHVSPKQTST